MPQQRQKLLPFASLTQSGQSGASSPSTDSIEEAGEDSKELQSTPPSPIHPHHPRRSASTKSKPRFSWVFQHMPDEDTETRYNNEITGKEEWRCRYCPKTYACSGGTGAPSDHLTDPVSKKGHGLPKNSPREAKAKNQQATIDAALATAERQNYKRRRLDDRPGGSIKAGALEVLYTRFIVACSLPLRLVECPEFREFLSYLNQDIDTWLPKNHQSIRTWIFRQYNDHKEKTKQFIQVSRSKVHISCDLWTSPNSLAILGVVAHFISADNRLQHRVLALRNIDGEHNGENLAEAIIQVVEDWGFVSKLGFFTMDNAGNNDTMMRCISRGKCT
jgi:hypothetical protein